MGNSSPVFLLMKQKPSSGKKAKLVLREKLTCAVSTFSFSNTASPLRIGPRMLIHRWGVPANSTPANSTSAKTAQQQQNPAAPPHSSKQHITKARTNEIEGTHTFFPHDFHKLTHRTAERSLRPSRLSRRDETRRGETRRGERDETNDPRLDHTTNERTNSRERGWQP